MKARIINGNEFGGIYTNEFLLQNQDLIIKGQLVSDWILTDILPNSTHKKPEWNGSEWFETYVEVIVVPGEISSMKFFLGLLELGITRSMLYAGINDDTEFGLTELDKSRLIEVIRTATDFKRNDPRLIMLAPKFGVTDLDTFFIMCNSIPTT